jgi:hypothetical protein
MYNSEFKVWLRGYFEITPDVVLDDTRIVLIQNHLNLVKAVEKDLDIQNTQIQVLLNKAKQSKNGNHTSIKAQIAKIVLDD